jgi:hypothetical protein
MEHGYLKVLDEDAENHINYRPRKFWNWTVLAVLRLVVESVLVTWILVRLSTEGPKLPQEYHQMSVVPSCEFWPTFLLEIKVSNSLKLRLERLLFRKILYS